MAFASIFKRRFYAAALMTAIILLQVALASISPQRLTSGLLNNGVENYFKAMDISKGNLSAAAETLRQRFYDPQAFWANTHILIANADIQASAAMMLHYLCGWLAEIGQEQSAAPHADMVSRK